MVETLQYLICKKSLCLQGMEDTSSFWVLSQSEPSSSALEEVAFKESILLTHGFLTGEIVSPREHLALSGDMFASQLRGATGLKWVDAATYPTVHRTVPTSKNDPALISMVPR